MPILDWKNLLIGKTQVITRGELPMSINWKETSQDLDGIAIVY